METFNIWITYKLNTVMRRNILENKPVELYLVVVNCILKFLFG